MVRDTLLISTHNCDRRPWNGVLYEFLDVISTLERATLVAPEAAAHGFPLNGRLVESVLPSTGKLRSRLRRIVLAGQGGRFRPTRIAQDHDICLFVCQFMRDLPNLRRVKDWRRRSRFAAAFILETWTPHLKQNAAALRILDEFDHVFVLNASSIPALQRYTRTPISFLATGVDALNACPVDAAPERVIDILSLGRQTGGAHKRIREFADTERLFYHFDVWSGLQARDWRQVRDWNAALMQRSRFSVVWSPAEHLPISLPPGEVVLSTRYFEGMAGGAILIGSSVKAPEAREFLGEDAVVEIAPDGSDFERVFAAIRAEPARLETMRTRNVAMSLRRHDWAYRWGEILQVANVEPTAAHRQRLAELARRAEYVEEAGHQIESGELLIAAQ